MVLLRARMSLLFPANPVAGLSPKGDCYNRAGDCPTCDNLWRYIVERVKNFLASFPYAETTKYHYGYVLSKLIDLDLARLSAASLLQFVNRPEWGPYQRYTALCSCRKFIRWLYGAGHPALSLFSFSQNSLDFRIRDAINALTCWIKFVGINSFPVDHAAHGAL